MSGQEWILKGGEKCYRPPVLPHDGRYLLRQKKNKAPLTFILTPGAQVAKIHKTLQLSSTNRRLRIIVTCIFMDLSKAVNEDDMLMVHIAVQFKNCAKGPSIDEKKLFYFFITLCTGGVCGTERMSVVFKIVSPPAPASFVAWQQKRAARCN